MSKAKNLIAIQMDHLDSINIKTDSTFLIGLELQRRGYPLFFYEPRHLSIKEGGAVVASGFTAQLHDKGRNHYHIIERINQLELQAARLILVRQDPPFDMNYITSTYLLDLIKDKTLILNNAAGIRHLSEKISPLLFPDIIPPTIISAQIGELMEFVVKYGRIVLKPLYDGGGRNVIQINSNQADVRTIIADYIRKFTYIMAQKFLEEISGGDKRVILIDGEPLGVFRRLAKAGDFRVNTALGGSVEACTLSEHDVLICNKLQPLLQAHGLFLVGIDIIGKYLIEINNTSPTGLVLMKALYQNSIEQKVVNFIERKMFTWYNDLTKETKV